jgi:hypothetical protein
MSIIMARIFLKERIGWMKLSGMLVCIAGILFLLSKGDFKNLLTLKFSSGMYGCSWQLFVLLSIIYWLEKSLPPFLLFNFLFVTFLFGSILLLPFFVWEHDHAPVVHWNSRLIGSILYLGIGASVICFFIWNISIRYTWGRTTALFGNLIPIFSSLEAVIILNEEFSWIHIVSMITVFAGLLLANLPVDKIQRAIKTSKLNKRPVHILPLIVLSQFAGTSLWFVGNAILPDIQRSLNIQTNAPSDITSVVQLGFIAGTLIFAIFSIADRVTSTKVFFVSSLIAALSNVSIIWFAKNMTGLYALRFLTGFFLAGIYPVGMKIASDWYEKNLGKLWDFL